MDRLASEAPPLSPRQLTAIVLALTPVEYAKAA